MRVSLCMINIWSINTEQDAKDVVKSLSTIITETVTMTNSFRRKKRIKQVTSKLNQVRMHCIANGWQEPLTILKVYFETIQDANDSEERLSSQMWEISKQ